MSKQQFTLMGYVPFMMIGIHESCATDTFQKLEFPSTAYKNSVRQKENKQIVHQFLFVENDESKQVRKIGKDDDDIAVTVDTTQYATVLSRWFDYKSCVLELVPMLPLLVLTDRRWNDNDFSSEQDRRRGGNDGMMAVQKSNKRHFVSIMNTMIECGLHWVRKDRSSSFYEMVPPIDKLSKFGFAKQEYRDRAKLKMMNQFVKQRMAHQIVLEVMRRNEAGFNKYRRRGDIEDELGNHDDDENGQERDVYDTMSEEIRTLTPFMSAKADKKRSRLNDRLCTPMGGGLFGKSKPSNLMTQQSPAAFGGVAKNKNFIAAHNRKTKIEKFEYKIQFRFVEGYS